MTFRFWLFEETKIIFHSNDCQSMIDSDIEDDETSSSTSNKDSYSSQILQITPQAIRIFQYIQMIDVFSNLSLRWYFHKRRNSSSSRFPQVKPSESMYSIWIRNLVLSKLELTRNLITILSLSNEIANSGDLSIIQRDLIPKQHKILPSPCNPKFHDIENITMNMQDYIILSIYFPNIVTIFGDISEVRVLCLSIEFQVVE